MNPALKHLVLAKNQKKTPTEIRSAARAIVFRSLVLSPIPLRSLEPIYLCRIASGDRLRSSGNTFNVHITGTDLGG